MQQPRSRWGEVNLACGAFEQLHAELSLELADSLRQRGSGHVEPSRGTAEVLFFGDRDEVGQPSEVHDPTVAVATWIMTS